MFNLKELKTKERNPRKVRDEKIEQLKKSITDFPKMLALRPIVYDPNTMEVIGGNQRLTALIQLGHKSVPDEWVKSADDLNEEEKKRFLIQDNVQVGDWDTEILNEDFDSDVLAEWGVDMADFESEEVEQLEAKEDDYEMPDEIQTDIVLGDLFEIGEHRLLCGDSTDSDAVEKLMGGEKADMVFTDPDYSMKDDDLFAVYANSLLLNPKSSFWVCADKQSVKLAKNDFENFVSFFIHDFKVPTLVSNIKAMQRHNMICCFGNSAMINRKDGFATIVSIATERTLESHKVVRMAKRVGLPAQFILHFTEKGKRIVDFFGHSGSTMVAAHELKRDCYMIEIEPTYCQVIVDRMLKLDPTLKITRNGQPYESKTKTS